MSKRTYCADDKCEFEVYKTDETYSKEEVYSKDDYKVISSSIDDVPNSSSKAIKIDYPIGYTQNNCVPISFGIKYSTLTNYIYESDSSNMASATLLKGNASHYTEFKDDGIYTTIFNENTSTTKSFDIKIVLMKIS